MRVDTMRIIDRWMGAPGCALLSGWNRLAGRRPDGAPPRNVLFVQLSEMGSIALAAPAVRRLRERWPGARPHFLVFRRNRAFLELLDLVDPKDIWTLDDSSLGAFASSSLAFFRRARGRPIDTVLDYEIFSRASMILSYLSGARERVGFDNYRAEGLYRGRLLTRPVFYNVYKHISLNFMAQVEALAADPLEQPCLKRRIDDEADLTLPKIETPPERAAEMRERLRSACPELSARARLVVVSPYSGNLLPIRAWPAEHYVAFLNGLLERVPDAAAVVIGLPEAREPCRPIFEGVDSPRLIDFIGRTKDIGEVVDLFNAAHLFVASDSGPPHFASLTRIPTLVMFGPECPMMYAPLGENVRSVFLGLSCSPCVSAFNHRDTPCQFNRCMREIDPGRMLDLALEALGDAPARDPGPDS